jgi:hypothetical protein
MKHHGVGRFIHFRWYAPGSSSVYRGNAFRHAEGVVILVPVRAQLATAILTPKNPLLRFRLFDMAGARSYLGLGEYVYAHRFHG